MRHAVAVACLLAAVTVHAQQTPDPITLDVIVDQSRQQPLTARDFIVTEGGQPIAVSAARIVQPPVGTAVLPAVASAEDERTAAQSAGRIVAVYVDEYHLSDHPAFVAARSAVASFLREDLGPDDLVLVLKPLDSLVSLRMTTDREQAARIVESTVPRQGDYVPRSDFERNFIAGAPARIDAARAQIALSSLNAIAQHLGRFSAGRKTLIVLSNVVPPVVPSRGEAPLPGIDAVARTANRARVAIYPVRPSPPDPVARNVSAGASPSADVLTELARQTTGFDVVGDDVQTGLKHVLRDASRYYLLTLDPPADRLRDGRFRAVDVRVRTAGATVRARAGYAGRRPESELLLARRSTLPAGLRIPRRTTTLIRTWFGQSAGDHGQTHVEFVWEPTPRPAGERGTYTPPARVSLVVTTMDGAPVFTGSSSPSGRDVVSEPSTPLTLTFASAPGTLLVQMEVQDAAGRVLDHDVRDLIVNPFAAAVSFGTAAVFRTRSVKELRAVDEGGPDVSPVAARQFSRAETLVVRLPVVLSGDRPEVSARLVRFGAALRTVPVALERDSQARVDLPLASLAPGGYVLEFSAHSSRGAAVVRLDFVVTP